MTRTRTIALIDLRDPVDAFDSIASAKGGRLAGLAYIERMLAAGRDDAYHGSKVDS